MTSISQAVRDYIEEKPFLQEALRQDIINFAALGAQIKPLLEQKLGQEVKQISVIQAIRRYQEKQSHSVFQKTHYGEEAEANLKTNLHMFTVERSNSVLQKLSTVAQLIDFRKGGVLHTVQGNYQVAIITNSYYVDRVKDILEGEVLIREDKNLVSIALKYSDDLIDIPGNLFLLTCGLAWENITIINTIETMSETIFIVLEKDSTRALQKLTRVMRTYC